MFIIFSHLQFPSVFSSGFLQGWKTCFSTKGELMIYAWGVILFLDGSFPSLEEKWHRFISHQRCPTLDRIQLTITLPYQYIYRTHIAHVSHNQHRMNQNKSVLPDHSTSADLDNCIVKNTLHIPCMYLRIPNNNQTMKTSVSLAVRAGFCLFPILGMFLFVNTYIYPIIFINDQIAPVFVFFFFFFFFHNEKHPLNINNSHTNKNKITIIVFALDRQLSSPLPWTTTTTTKKKRQTPCRSRGQPTQRRETGPTRCTSPCHPRRPRGRKGGGWSSQRPRSRWRS